MNCMKLDYYSLYEVLEKLNELKTAFDNTRTHIERVQMMLENNNTGEVIDSLIELCNTAITNINSQQDNVKVSISILNDYIDDTSYIIKPKNDRSKVKINYSDLKVNFDIIKKALSEINNAKKELETEPSWYNDGHSIWDDEDEGDSEAYTINKSKLESLSDDVYNLKLYTSEKLLFLDDVEKIVSNLINHDESVASELNSLNKGKYDITNTKGILDSGMDVNIDILVDELDRPDGMNDAEFDKYKAEYKNQLESLKEEGWDYGAMQEYGNYINENVNSIGGLIVSFDKTKEIGSEVYTRMFEMSGLKSENKLELMKRQMEELGYQIKPDFDYRNAEGQDFFTIINFTVYNSGILEDYNNNYTMYKWLHYDLRLALNNSGAFAPYEDMNDDDILRMMINQGWTFAGENPVDTVNASRYHAMLPEGYSSYEEFKDEMGYDLRYNVKILSENGCFERVYNTELGKFVDVDPYMYTATSEIKTNKFKSTAVNMPTYNYGYEKGMKNGHTKLDVNPFKKLSGSMKDPATQKNVDEYPEDRKIYQKFFRLQMLMLKTKHLRDGNTWEFRSAYGKIQEYNDEFSDEEGIPFKGQ